LALISQDCLRRSCVHPNSESKTGDSCAVAVFLLDSVAQAQAWQLNLKEKPTAIAVGFVFLVTPSEKAFYFRLHRNTFNCASVSYEGQFTG